MPLRGDPNVRLAVHTSPPSSCHQPVALAETNSNGPTLIFDFQALPIFKRLRKLAGPRGLKAANLAQFTVEELRSVGLSPQKASYVTDLVRKVNEGTVDLRQIGRLSDERIMEQLIQVKGIGRWTAQMFLIFSLGRLDVFPHDDLGVRSAIRDNYGWPICLTKRRPSKSPNRGDPTPRWQVGIAGSRWIWSRRTGYEITIMPPTKLLVRVNGIQAAFGAELGACNPRAEEVRSVNPYRQANVSFSLVQRHCGKIIRHTLIDVGMGVVPSLLEFEQTHGVHVVHEVLLNPLFSHADVAFMDANTWHPAEHTAHQSVLGDLRLIEHWKPKRTYLVHYSGYEDRDHSENAIDGPMRSDRLCEELRRFQELRYSACMERNDSRR